MTSSRLGGELADALEAVEAASPVDAVDAVTGKLAGALCAERAAFLIADLAGRVLVRLGHGDGAGADARRLGVESAESLPLTDHVIANVLSEQCPVTVRALDSWRVLAPVTQRGEVVGVLELLLSYEPDDGAVQVVQRAAHILAFAVIVNRRHTDLFEWGQRTTRFELSAEIQRRLLPGAFTCEGEITPVQLPVDLPFGLNAGRGYRRTDLKMEPGDRFVIVTDGMLERRAAALPLTALLQRARLLHPREATRHLADAVLEVAGPQLADDATIFVLDWHGKHGRQRDSSAGSDRH